MSIAKRLHQLYQDKYLQPIYRRRLNSYLSTLQQNTMEAEDNRITFGKDTIESLEEKKRQDDQAAEIGKMH
jgi:hypothetical protein